jgi:hypothetical protein
MERHEHIVSSYEEELSFLNNKVAKMGGLAERVVGQSLDALERRDRALAENTWYSPFIRRQEPRAHRRSRNQHR